jgi:hypothetical protein
MAHFFGHIFNLTFSGPYVILPPGNVAGIDTGMDAGMDAGKATELFPIRP